MGTIGTAASLGGALAVALAAPSGAGLALAGFFVGGTLGGAVGALALAALRSAGGRAA